MGCKQKRCPSIDLRSAGLQRVWVSRLRYSLRPDVGSESADRADSSLLFEFAEQSVDMDSAAVNAMAGAVLCHGTTSANHYKTNGCAEQLPCGRSLAL